MGQNINFRNGILPYGSDDDSIILRSSLKSAASITSPEIGTGGTVVDITGATHFDSDMGILCDDDTNEGYATWNTYDGYLATNNAGQLSIEVQSNYFATLEASVYTGRTVNETVTRYLMSSSNQSATGGIYQYWALAAATDIFRIPKETSGGLATAFDMIAVPDGDFVTMTVSWQGDYADTYFNGMHVGRALRNKTTDIWKYLYIGNERTRTTGYGRLNYYARNLQISTRPVMFGTLANVRVSFVGDSLIGESDPETIPHTFTEALGHVRAQDVFQGRLRQRGLQVQTYQQGVGGNKISEVEARKAEIIADNPTHIVLQLGSNNTWAVAPVTAAAFDTEYRALVNYFLQNGVQYVFCGTIPSVYWDSALVPAEDFAATEARRIAYNEKIEAMTDITGVVVMDMSAELGGTYGDPYMFKGQVTGLQDDVHPSGFGQYRMGNLWADACIPIIGNV